MSNVLKLELAKKGKIHTRSRILLDLENSLIKLSSAYKYLEKGGLITEQELKLMLSEVVKISERYQLTTSPED